MYKVYYGWAKLNKIQKKEGIWIAFANVENARHKTVSKSMDIVHEREQTKGEVQDCKNCNREYTAFFMDFYGKYQGSLNSILDANDKADKNNVKSEERIEIRNKLRKSFLLSHPEYKEPIIEQTLFDIDNL